MAYSKITKTNIGLLKAKIQAYGVDPETGKKKLYIKTIYNDDGLTEAKFKKYVAKVEYEFEESLKTQEFQKGKQVKADNDNLTPKVIENPIVIDNNRVLTFMELINEWKATVLVNLSKNYYRRICEVAERFNKYLITKELADKPISAITVRDVQMYLNSFVSGEPVLANTVSLKKPFPKKVCLRELSRQKIVTNNSSFRLLHANGKIRYDKAMQICEFYSLDFEEYFDRAFEPKKYSVETIKGHRRILRTLFNEAIRYEWITKNPVCSTKIGSGAGNSCSRAIAEKEVFSIAEAKKFLKLLDELPEELIYRRVTLKFMILTGVRTAELHGLRWSDFDFERKHVRIQRNRLYTEGFGVYEKETKSKTSTRDIPLTDDLIEELQRYMEWFRLADKDFDKKLDEYYFSVNIYREPESTSGTNQWLKNFEKKHGLRPVTAHGLRHTYCSLLLANNVPIQTVSKYMGHSDSTITLEVYSHFIPDTKERVIDALSTLKDD